MRAERIKRLREAYAGIHEQVLAAYRRSDNPNIRDLQDREYRIVKELRELGAEPYEPLHAARAL
jgi:uncharacterized membrane protein (DUF106 family)